MARIMRAVAVSTRRAFRILKVTQVRLNTKLRNWNIITTNRAVVFETAYLLKHVELHGRPGTMTPWSIRQFGIYQKFDTVTKHSSCIFIQTSLDIQRRLAEVQKDQKTSKDVIDHWTCLHLLCIGTLGKNWAVYIKFLDKKVAEIVSRLFLLLNERNARKSKNTWHNICFEIADFV